MNQFILAQATVSPPADWVLFWGHFHPLIVHLPIGFLLIAGLLELDRLTRRNTVSQHTITLILFWSAVSATMACLFGYMLSLGGGYEAETLDSHKWEGIGVAVFAWLAWSVKSENLGRIIPIAQLAYLPALGVALLLLLFAGHNGGNLTHGSDYLTQYAPGPIRSLAGLPPKQPTFKAEPIKDVNQAMVYQQIVNPILQTRCVQCHNAEKSKADLRLDSPEMIKKGYEDGPVFVSGKSANSELIKVCLLPVEDDHHMPPKGKNQLTEGQIALLTWWIDQGAPFDKKVSDLTVNDAIRPVLASLNGGGPIEAGGSTVASAPAPESPVLTMKMEAADPKAVDELKKAGLLVLPLSKEQNQLEVSAVNARSFNDAQAALLPKVSKQLVWLKLGDTQISDAALAQVAKLENLQKLHLEQTKITDAGLKQLKNLPNLEYLNLYGTGVTDAGLAELTNLKNLKTVYLWQTKVTDQGVANLKKAMPKLDVIGGLSEQAIAELAKTAEPAK
ncbi:MULTISPECIES: leucine-rich repeat domain-containing protein [unclassified Spirosoma]|uniref:leucine-rich repeat domain-containing protein n=1 Tax=unclassified Spirosoma TaxID=2621999 RepID=UPI000962D560|nr:MULTISPECIES: leucine-rich repeat domain-containing protein [unclassified Spirosoma]MBN8824843.1 ribonuclease inhibitor [Spirosoma sp.]OJW77008.1 MAG: ribonuclease inhibitor [Spirosoma sp. 48-14]